MAGPVESEALKEVLARYAAPALGIAIGTAAKYGLLLTDGKRLTWHGALADMLMVGMLCLLAIAISDWLHLTGNAKVLAGALVGVSSDRLIRLARDRFLKASDGQMAKLLPLPEHEAIMHVPAGTGDPDSVGVQAPPVSGTERMSWMLKRSYGRSGKQPTTAEQIELLRRLDDD